MLTTFFAKKLRMTGKYTPEGNYVGATILSIPEMKVVDLKTREKNGYNAIKLRIQGKGDKKEVEREIRTEEILEPETIIKFEEILKPGDKIKISGISKGKGFAGVVKRHHFKGGPRTHGQSNRERSPGSSGSTTTPGRVSKGKRRAGHMGNIRISLSGLKVLEVNPETQLLVVGGGVPGPGREKGGLITITKQ